jgi:hypothetical protein
LAVLLVLEHTIHELSITHISGAFERHLRR